jgi:hypothetical protein
MMPYWYIYTPAFSSFVSLKLNHKYMTPLYYVRQDIYRFDGIDLH